MSNVTEILNSIERGDRHAAAQLLPLVYRELRQLASHRVSRERTNGTLDATSLVHEAYLRLVGNSDPQQWDNRAHFFAAAAEAMRRILVESARSRMSEKRGGNWNKRDIDSLDLPLQQPTDDILSVSEALESLEDINKAAANVVKLRYFGGFTMSEIAAMLQISPRTADNLWAYARAWLACEIQQSR